MVRRPGILRMPRPGAVARREQLSFRQRSGCLAPNVAGYGRVECPNVYPGIDVVYHSDHGRLEYDLVVAPGANPQTARLTFAGGAKLEATAEGGLRVSSGGDEILLAKPKLYQEIRGTRAAVAGGYTIDSAQVVHFQAGKYDRSRPLVIDPTVIYSLALGGSANSNVNGIALDSSGNAYITGQTSAINFPGAGTRTATSYPVAYVAKVNPAGNGLVYSTYIAGVSGSTTANGIALDAQLNAYIAGVTSSPTFPVTNGFCRGHIREAASTAATPSS